MDLIVRKKYSGFTFVELMVAMAVMGVIFAAIATLASAMSSADEQTKDMSERQARIRFSTMRIREKVRSANLIIPITSNIKGFCLWNDSNLNAQCEGEELTYIYFSKTDASSSGTSSVSLINGFALNFSGIYSMKMVEFVGENTQFTIADVESGNSYAWCLAKSNSTNTKRELTLMDECTNVRINIDDTQKSVGIKFDAAEGGVGRSYEVFATKRCSIDYALDGSGEIDTGGDDDI